MDLLQSSARIMCTHNVDAVAVASVIYTVQNGTLQRSDFPAKIVEETSRSLVLTQHTTSAAKQVTDSLGVRPTKLTSTEERRSGVVRAEAYCAYWQAVVR